MAKTRFCRNLVKPPGASVSCQAADSDGNINLEIWQVYPLQFAILEIENKSRNKQARPESGSRLFYWSPNEKQITRFVRGEAAGQASGTRAAKRKRERRTGRTRVPAQGGEP